MTLREVVQANFSKGILATAQRFAEPKGILRNASNLMFTRRGALLVRDGDSVIASLNCAGPAAGQGIILDVSEYSPVGLATELLFLQVDPNSPLSAPASLVAGTPTAGGSFAAGTYFWAVTATDGIGGETTVSNEVSKTVTANQQVPLSWAAVTNASGYNIYRGTASGAETLLASVSTNSFTDTGAPPVGSFSILASPNGIIEGLGITTVMLTTSAAVQASQLVSIVGASPSGFNVSYTSAAFAQSGTSIILANQPLPANTTGGGGTLNVTPVSPPSKNTTSQTVWVEVNPITSCYSKPSSVLAYFPAALITAIAGTTGGSGGSGGGGGGGGDGGGGGKIPPPTF